MVDRSAIQVYTQCVYTVLFFADMAQVKVGRWWYDFSSANKGERKQRVEESAPDEATKKALQYLAQCPMRDHGKCDVKGDARRVRLVATYVRDECGGQLPRPGDVAALAGWEHEDAGVAQVPVGTWWRDFSSAKKGERKKRVEESAPDEATKKALQYLAQCPMRDRKNDDRRARDVKCDSRRVCIFATYVRENGLPTFRTSAALADWAHEGADVAQVKVGQWWYDFSSNSDGARKQRVETLARLARDEETQKALRYLAQCKVRDDKRLKRRRN